MSVEVKYNFDDPQNFDFDTETVEIANSEAKLKLANNPDQSFNQDFSDDTGFTYDSDKAEFTEPSPGVYRVEQKNQIPADANFGALWNQFINANWGSVASLVPTSTLNNPQIVGGKLDLVGGKNVIYNVTGAINPNIGAIKCKFTPNWNGTPAADQQMFYYSQPGGTQNRLFFSITATGALRLSSYNSSGVSTGVNSFGNWTDAVQGQEYEFEINWDFTPGFEEQRIFIDGIQQSAVANRVSSRDDNLTENLEYRQGGTGTSDHLVRDLVIYDTVQHTANYTPGYTLPAQPYAEASVVFPPFVYPGQGAIQIFQEIANVAFGNGKYIVNGRWYDGGSWVVSNGTYAESNTIAEINANFASSPVANSIVMTLIFPESASVQSWVQDFTFTYTGQQYVNGSTVIPNMGIPVTALLEFVDEKSTPTNTEIRYTIGVNGTLYWFNGGAWVVSDQSQGQTNTAADVNANADTLPLSEAGEFIRPKIYFYTDGSATPSIQSLCMFVIYDVNPIDRPGTTLIFGSLLDMIAEPMVGRATLRVVNENQFFIEGNSIQPDSVQAEANDEGLAIVQVIKTASIGHQYAFFIDYVNENNQNRTIALGRSIAPDDQASNIANLTFS